MTKECNDRSNDFDNQPSYTDVDPSLIKSRIHSEYIITNAINDGVHHGECMQTFSIVHSVCTVTSYTACKAL